MKEITNWENANEEVLANEEQEEKEAVLIDSVDEKTDDVFAKLLAEIADEKSDANDESNDSNESNGDSDEYEDDEAEDDSDEKLDVATSDESEEKPKKGLSRGQSAALIAIGAILALLLIWLFLNALGLFRTDDYNYTGGNNTDSVVVIPSGTDKDDDADKVITDGKENDNNGDVNKGNGNNDDDKNSNNGNSDQKDQNGNSGDKDNSSKDDSSDKDNASNKEDGSNKGDDSDDDDSNKGDDSEKNDNSQNGDNDSDGKNDGDDSDDKNTDVGDGDDTSDGDNDNDNKEQEEKLYAMLDTAEFYTYINEMLYDFSAEHNHLWQVGFNGRSSGYLVLYQGYSKPSGYKSYCTECGQRNYKSVEETGNNRCGRCGADARVNYTTPPREIGCYPGRSTDMGEDFEDWEMYQLKERVKLVREFDKLCDDILKTVIDLIENYEVEEQIVMKPHTVKVLREVAS